jgi:hypothetical protein
VELLAALTGATPSVGFAHGMLQRTAARLAGVSQRIRELITLAPVVCCDETPIKVGPRRPRACHYNCGAPRGADCPSGGGSPSPLCRRSGGVKLAAA